MGTNFHKIMGLIGGVIAFVGFIPYIVSMVRGKSKPNRASWAIWSVMGFVILGTYYASGARNNLPATIALATGPAVTFLFTLRYGKGGDNSFDRTCIIGAIVSILLWKGLKLPVLALSGALITDCIGAFSTWRDLRKAGHEEQPHGWVIWSVANVFNMFTIEHLTIQDAIYPTYYLVGTGYSTYLVLRGHWKKTQNEKPSPTVIPESAAVVAPEPSGIPTSKPNPGVAIDHPRIVVGVGAYRNTTLDVPRPEARYLKFLPTACVLVILGGIWHMWGNIPIEWRSLAQAEARGGRVIYTLSVVLAAVLSIGSSLVYAVWVWRRQTGSAPATWVLMFVMMTMASWMYFTSPEHSLTGNIGLLAAAVNTTVILAAVLTRRWLDGTLGELAFNWVQRFCLGSGAVIVTGWLIAKQSDTLVAYCLVQFLGVIAYAATVHKLWRATATTERYPLWVCGFLGCLAALYPAITRNDLYSKIYLLRAIPSTLGMTLLIWRIKRRMATTSPS